MCNAFLGFTNFNCKFIRDYSKLIFPLTQVTKKGQSFVWTKEANTTFERLHPVTFHSRKFDATEINYEIHDKDLLAIVDSFANKAKTIVTIEKQYDTRSTLQAREYFLG